MGAYALVHHAGRVRRVLIELLAAAVREVGNCREEVRIWVAEALERGVVDLFNAFNEFLRRGVQKVLREKAAVVRSVYRGQGSDVFIRAELRNSVS